MSKFPKLSKPKLLKAQVTQSSSHPKYKLPKMPKVQVAPAKNVSSPTMTKQRKMLHGQKYLWPSNSQTYEPHMAQNINDPPMANKHFNVKM